MKRAYTDGERAELVALATTIGDWKAAARQLSIPVRTAYNWRAELVNGDGRTSRVIPAETRKEVADKFWEVIQAGAARLVDGMTDPKARLGDVAQATRVAIESHALLTGSPTSHNLNMNLDNPYPGMSPEEIQKQWDQERKAREFLGALRDLNDDELAAYLASSPNVIAVLREPAEQETP